MTKVTLVVVTGEYAHRAAELLLPQPAKHRTANDRTYYLYFATASSSTPESHAFTDIDATELIAYRPFDSVEAATAWVKNDIEQRTAMLAASRKVS